MCAEPPVVVLPGHAVVHVDGKTVVEQVETIIAANGQHIPPGW